MDSKEVNSDQRKRQIKYLHQAKISAGQSIAIFPVINRVRAAVLHLFCTRIRQHVHVEVQVIRTSAGLAERNWSGRQDAERFIDLT